MTVRRQLIVRHRALDPTAWTALHALERLARRGRPLALARAVLWEFEREGDASLEGRLEEWVAAANWFANPNRDRATWRRAAADPTDIEAGAALATGGVGSRGRGAHLVAIWRGAEEALEHAEAASRALGVPVAVRHGLLWWLAAGEGSAAEILDEAGGGAAGGLLVNPHSQSARVHAGALPVPALAATGAPGEGSGPAEAEGGAT